MLAVRYKTRECPCCGAPGQVKAVNTPHSHGWVGCTACGLYIQWNRDPKDALEKWNRRAAPTGPYDLLYEEGGANTT